MKRITLIALCAAVAGGSLHAADLKLHAIFKSKAQVTRGVKGKKSVKSYAKKAAEAMPLWRAQTQTGYWWNSEDWELSETYQISYDENGNKKTQTVFDAEGYVSRESYTWNENGMLATRLGEVDEEGTGDFVESSRLRREYDSRLISFITFNDQEAFYGDSWVPSNSYKQTITRDASGNITLMERAVYFQGIYDPVFRLAITYGEDGKASTIEASELKYDYASQDYYWEVTDLYSDIVWEETDGQIVGIEDMEDLFLGANRIKSATMEVEGQTGELKVDYLGDDCFTATMTVEDEEMEGVTMLGTVEYGALDFDSDDGITKHIYKGHSVTTTTDFLYGEEVLGREVIKETYIYSPDDLIILEQVEYGDGENFEIESRIEGEVEYDEEHGYPVAWTVSEYDYDLDEILPSFRAEYSDYVSIPVSGVEEIDVTSSDSSVRYYNLQGQEVKNPTTGLYIRVKGNKSEKIMK